MFTPVRLRYITQNVDNGSDRLLKRLVLRDPSRAHRNKTQMNFPIRRDRLEGTLACLFKR